MRHTTKESSVFSPIFGVWTDDEEVWFDSYSPSNDVVIRAYVAGQGFVEIKHGDCVKMPMNDPTLDVLKGIVDTLQELEKQHVWDKTCAIGVQSGKIGLIQGSYRWDLNTKEDV